MIRAKTFTVILCSLVFLSGCGARRTESFNVDSFTIGPIYGYDVLSLAKQKLDVIKQEITPNSAIGVLEGTFGEAIPPLEEILNTGKIVAFRAHLGNGPCNRAKNCQSGEPSPYNLKVIQRRAKNYEALALRHPGIQCYLSPFLEHDVKDKELVKTWVSILEDSAPSCRVVISAFTGFKPKGVLIEEHGNTRKGDIVSNDGVSLFDSNSPDYRTHGKVIVFGWIHRFNGRLSSEKGVFVPPKQRKWQATRDNIRQVTRLLRAEEVKPGTTCEEIKKPNLWKSNAEDYGVNPDGRGDRPLFITRTRVDGFKVNDLVGRQIGCARYYGLYETPQTAPATWGYRYYVGSCSSDSGVTLMDKAKGEWVILRGGGKCFLSSTIRRKGYYR